jgi:Ca-activated chloride channel homolog
MKFSPMKIRGLGSLFSLMLAGVLLAQDGGNDLPAAPSAAKQSQRAPAAQAPASETKPETPAPPASEPSATQAQGTKPAAPQILEKPPEETPETTIVRSVNEVNVVFTVTDKRGRLIKDLKKEDFKVIDDGRPDTNVRSFQRQTDLPLRVGLLVDASNSVRDRFKFEQESAIEFLNQTIRAKTDKAFVVGFDATPEVTQDFTENTELLSKGVRMLRPGGGTAMFDAVYFACRDKLAKEQQTGPMRRAIVLLSDGDDNQSHVTREETIAMAQRAEVIIYTISTNLTGSKNSGDKVLKYMAETTGGRAFFPFQITEVANAFAEIQDELRSQYALSYHPAAFATDGRYHTIEILAQNRKGLKVRSRRGYYAPAR